MSVSRQLKLRQPNHEVPLRGLGLIVALGLALASGLPCPAMGGQLGDFNAAPFGWAYMVNAAAQKTYSPALTDGDPSTSVDLPAGGLVQVEWNEPRDVHAVRLVFAGNAPDAGDARLSWWYHRWPDNGEGGWMKLDDPFNGKFVTAAVDRSRPKGSMLT